MSKLNLLLLEEDILRAKMMQSIFEQSGLDYKVSHISMPEQLPFAMESSDPDVVLSGNFHGVEGRRSIIHVLDASGKKIPFVTITNPVDDEYAISLMKAGAFNFVLKEHLTKVPAAVKNAIEKYHLSEKREKYLNDILPREAMMKEAERLARFGSWKQDTVANTIWWSDQMYRILGYEPGEVVPSWDNFIVRVHPEDVEFVTQTMDEAVKNQDKAQYTFRIQDPGGEIRYIHAEIYVTRNKDFDVTLLNGFIRDMSEHVQAEIRSVESEENYHNLFEKNPCSLTLIEIDSKKILDVNKATTELFGYTREEFLGMDAMAVLPEKELTRYNKMLQDGGKKSLVTGDKGAWEIKRKDGSNIFVEVNTTDLKFDGRMCRLIQATDVTDKVLSIRKLQESEARLIDSQRIAHIGSWEVNYQDGEEPIKWSDETYRIFGLDPEKEHINEELFYSLIHPADVHLLDRATRAAYSNNGIYSVEFRIMLPDGSERLVSELGEMTLDPTTGRLLKIAGTAQDITERRNARMMLQKSEANLRSIFENTDTAYVLLDTTLKIVSFNGPAHKFSLEHLDKPIAEGEEAVSYFSHITQAVVKKSLRDALNGANLGYEVNYPTESGINKWYYAHFYPVWDNDARILGVVMSLRDITQRKTSELQEKKITTELIQRNKDLEQFAYIISHNLRAPVANIIGITDALKDDLDEDERNIFMSGLYDSVKKLDNVITDLNRILQLKNGLSENKERIQFSSLVNEIKYTISGGGTKEMFQVKSDFDEVDEMVTLKSYMHSIFYNLISNSIKYKRPDLVPVIEITSKKVTNGIELVFKDNGLGIDMEKNGKMLFGLYKRFNQDAAEGKGMGLFMVKTQVETLGGRIGVKSKVNHGTEFKIEFSM